MRQKLNIPGAIRGLREDKGMSQGDLFDLTGLKEGYISKLENGHIKPKIKTIKKLAEAFELSVSEFFDYAENTKGGKKIK